MTSLLSDIARLLKLLDRVLLEAVTRKLELRVYDAVKERVPRFIHSAPGATCSFGLLLTDEDFNSFNSNANLFEAVRRYKGQEKLIPLSFKCISPDIKDGRYRYTIRCSPDERSVVAFIVMNPAAPNTVLVIPHVYLRTTEQARRPHAHHSYHSETAPCVSLDIPSIPMEWMIFAMDIEYLPAAVESLDHFSRKEIVNWQNPQTHLVFQGFPTPCPQKVDLLLSSTKSEEERWEAVDKIRVWLDESDSGYRYQRSHLRQSIGHFQFLQIATGEITMVEIKHLAASVNTNGVCVHNAFEKHDNKRHFTFTPTSNWDFVLSGLIDRPNHFLLLARDDIPTSWFQPSLGSRDAYAWQCNDPSFFDRHTVPLTSAESFIAKMVPILNSYSAEKALRSSRILPTFLATPEIVKEDMDEEDLEELLEQEAADTEAFRVVHEEKQTRAEEKARNLGLTGRFSRERWETAQEKWIIEQCEKQKYGYVYRLGTHPSGRFVFVPGHHENNRTSFEDLHIHTPMIYLNFAVTAMLDNRLPTDARRPALYLRSTHGSSSSIFILLGLPIEYTHTNMNRFVIPSYTLASSERRKLNTSIVEEEQRYHMGSTELVLKKNEMLDLYSCQGSEVVSRLQSFFQQPYNVNTVFVGDDNNDLCWKLKLKKILVNKQTVLQEFLDMQEGRTYFAQLDKQDEDSDLE